MKNNFFCSHKKSQVTVFMIVGLLVVIGGVFFYYSTKKIQEPLQPEIKIIQEKVPVEFDPVKNYVTECVYSSSLEGLKIIGSQGGYVSLSNKTLNKEQFMLNSNPTESDAVSFTEDSNLKIPYWWYLKSANTCTNCKFASKRPDLRQSENSIEKQLERYVNAKLNECLNDFEPLRELGYSITNTGNLNTDVTIGAEDILVLAEYPLIASTKDTKSELKQFVALIPLNLNKIYELSTKISNLEIKHHFLEKHILNLLVAFSGLDKEKLPPMAEMQFNFGNSLSWQKSSIKNKITELLTAYVPLFQVDGTYNYERNTFNSELKQRLYDSTILPVANTSFNDLSVYFTYLDFWPIHFDLNCKGERCTPSSANSLVSLFGIQDYRFVYDLSFPVLVEINDPLALNGQGYSFNFFLEGNIRNNKFLDANSTLLEMLPLSERSQLCDIKSSGNITINVVDSATKIPIDNAQILYTLVDESCFIGSTKEGILKETFPMGIGGVVNVVKDGYVGKSVEFDAKIDSEDSLNIEITPISTKKIVVKKKNLVKTLKGWEFVNEPVELNSKESATVSLTRINSENELEFSSFANLFGQQGPAEIEISPGDYSADINLVLDDRIVIPEKEKCVNKFLIFGRECFTIPKVEFGSESSPGQERFPEGGSKIDITLSPGDLLNHNTIVLYALSIDLISVPEQDRVVEDLEQLGKIEDYSKTYLVALQPEFE